MESLTLVLLLGTIILIGIFIFQAQQFKSNLLSENEEEVNEIPDHVAPPTISDPFWKRMRQVVDDALQHISTNPASTENEQKPDTALHAMLKIHHATVLERGLDLLQNAIQKDKAQTLLFTGKNGPVYLMAFPFQGDRPSLLRQTEGFSSGLVYHIEQIFSQGQTSNKAETPLIFVALFYKISEQKGALYAGYRDKIACMLPRALLSSGEIARYSNALSNFRQII